MLNPGLLTRLYGCSRAVVAALLIAILPTSTWAQSSTSTMPSSAASTVLGSTPTTSQSPVLQVVDPRLLPAAQRDRIFGGDTGTTTNGQRTFREPGEGEYFPPEPPSEFQKFLFQATGQWLRVYGDDLFQGVPSTFAPADQVPVTSEYILGPGDELVIKAWGQIDINYRATVDRTGAIFIPKVGAVNVTGVRYGQVQE